MGFRDVVFSLCKIPMRELDAGLMSLERAQKPAGDSVIQMKQTVLNKLNRACELRNISAGHRNWKLMVAISSPKTAHPSQLHPHLDVECANAPPHQTSSNGLITSNILLAINLLASRQPVTVRRPSLAIRRSLDALGDADIADSAQNLHSR